MIHFLQPNLFTDDYVLVVAGGGAPSNSSATTTLLPLYVDSLECSSLPPQHPRGPVVGAVGAVLGKRLRQVGEDKKINALTEFFLPKNRQTQSTLDTTS